MGVGVLIALAWLGFVAPPVSAQPVVSFSPLSNTTVSPGQLFDFSIRIDFGPGGVLQSGSILLDGVDVTALFAAAINSGAVQVNRVGSVTTLTVPGVSFPQPGQHQVEVRVNTTTGPTIGLWSVTVSSGTATLSPYQQSIIATHGNPDYWTITFNTAPQRREESWSYLGIQKIFTFHDGEYVDEAILVAKGGGPKPPRLSPSGFTRNMTLATFTSRFGMAQSSTTPKSNLTSYHFVSSGVLAGFLGSTLVNVTTVDVP